MSIADGVVYLTSSYALDFSFFTPLASNSRNTRRTIHYHDNIHRNKLVHLRIMSRREPPMVPKLRTYLPSYIPSLHTHHSQTALLALGHSITCYTTSPSTSLTILSNASSRTRLLAHMYAVQNIYAGLIRSYAAANLRHCRRSTALYDLAMATYGIMLGFLVMEMCVWKTVRGREAVWVLGNAGIGVVWMGWERGWYLGA